MEINNNKLLKVLDEKIDRVEKKLDRIEERLDRIEERLDRVEERLDRVEERLDKVEGENKTLYEKIVDMGFYFEETYGSKISAIFDKLQLIDEKQSIQKEKIKKHLNHNDALLMSHDIRITNLEKVVNSK